MTSRDEYKKLATIIWACDSPITFEELYDKLTNYEMYLKHEDKLAGPTITSQINQKSKRKSNQYNKSINKGLAKLSPDHIGLQQISPSSTVSEVYLQTTKSYL